MEAVLLAGAYLLRVWMVGSYMQHVRERAFGTPTSKHVGAAAQAAIVGRVLAWKIMLSAGALTTLPSIAGASWFYGACQFASLEALEDGTERHSFTGCLALASQWFGGGLLLFLMLVPLWIAVWLNGLILAMMLPQLLQGRQPAARRSHSLMPIGLEPIHLETPQFPGDSCRRSVP